MTDPALISRTIGLEEALKLYNKVPGVIFVDIREGLAEGIPRIPHAIALPPNRINNLDNLPVERKVVSDASVLVLYCDGTCPGATRYASVLTKYNKSVYIFEGGISRWIALGLPVG